MSSSAVSGISLGASVEALRKKVLDAAVRGELTEQRAEDGTAVDLIKEIAAEKAALVTAGKLKKEKPLPAITEDEIPFEIPENWEWVRLGELGSFKKGPFGSALTKSIFVPKSETAIKVYEQKNAIKKDATLGNYYISREYFEEKMLGFEVATGDIIVSCAGTIGETYILPANIEKGIINQALMRMKIIKSIHQKYFLLYFDYILKKASQTESNGVAITNIPPFDLFKKFLVPLPPLAEQHRIVEKVDSIFHQLDELKTLQTAYASNLEALRKKVIEDGVRGNLTEHLADDGSAADLLKEIAAERAALVAAGKMKKEKPLKPVSEEEMPFEIPESWEWVRLGNLFEINPRYKLEDELEVSFIPMQLIEDGYSNKHTSEMRKWSTVKSGFTHIQEGDIGVAKITPCFQNRKSVIFTNLKNGFGAGTTELHIFHPITQYVDSFYLLWFLKSYYFISNGVDSFSGTAGQQRVSTDFVKNVLFPLPPLAEQRRIVAKVKGLMKIIDGM